MGRPRKFGSKDLPTNLYTHRRKAGGKYYRYRVPGTREERGLGTNREIAIAAAHRLNEQLASSPDLVARILGAVTLEDLAHDWWDSEFMPSKPAPKTVAETKRYIRKLPEEFKALAVGRLTTRNISDYLLTLRPRTGVIVRSLLLRILERAVARGLRETNPVDHAIRPKHVVTRTRLGFAEFQQIRAEVEQVYRNAMDISLHLGLRRGDVVKLPTSSIHGGFVHIVPEKARNKRTRKRRQGVRFRIGPKLQEVLDACDDGLESEFVLHRRVETASGPAAAPLRPESLSRAFQDARDRLGLFADLEPNQRPSFHEIRALAGDLRKRAGWTDEAIQAFLCHSVPATTARYLSGHDVVWVTTEGGLQLPDDDKT